MDNGFSPRETIQDSIRYWWLVALFVFLGGLVGYGASLFRRPLYEARIVYTFNIDFSRTGVLTDVEEDQAMETAGDVLASTAVMEAALRRAAAQGVTLSREALQAASTRERTSNTWIIRVRQPDPRAAQTLANAWGAAAGDAFAAALEHTVTVEGLSRYLDALESCLSVSAAVEPVQPTCAFANLNDLLKKIEQTGAALRQERIASLGLFPGMGYHWSEQAGLPARPVAYGRNSAVLAGALTGLLLSVLLLASGAILRIRRHG